LDVLTARVGSNVVKKNFANYVKLNNKNSLNPLTSEVLKDAPNVAGSDAVKYALGKALFDKQLTPAKVLIADTALDTALDMIGISAIDYTLGDEFNTQATRSMYSVKGI
jgi:hypothetical protein